MLDKRFRQGIAEPRPPDVEWIAERAQRVADPAGYRGFLVQNNQDRRKRRGRWPRLRHEGSGITRKTDFGGRRHRPFFGPFKPATISNRSLISGVCAFSVGASGSARRPTG